MDIKIAMDNLQKHIEYISKSESCDCEVSPEEKELCDSMEYILEYLNWRPFL